MSAFASAEDTWRQRLQMLPNTVRQELVARELLEHMPAAPARVLDVGCGQGTQALRLAELGYDVVGLDHSPAIDDEYGRELETVFVFEDVEVAVFGRITSDG